MSFGPYFRSDSIKMPKDTAEDIRKRMVQGFDPSYYASLYRQMCYAFGDEWSKTSAPVNTGLRFPDWPEIVVKYMRVGQSRRILNTSLYGLASNMSADPSPEFPQLDKFTGEVRKQAYLTRYAGCTGEGEWQAEHEDAYIDGDGLGLGFVHFGVKTNPKTNLQYTCCEHSPACMTIFDPHERKPGRARWIAFAKYLAVDQAVALFGSKVAQQYTRSLWDSGAEGEARQVVRVFDYYSLGMGKNPIPTRAIIPGDLGETPISIDENEFECLPFSYMTNVLLPGMQRPTGRIVMQMSVQEGINEIERHLRKALKNPGFNMLDLTQLDPNDVKRLNAGDTNVNVKIVAPRPGEPPFLRVQGAEVAQTVLALHQMYERQFNADSGTTDMDRGTTTTNDTLGQDELLDSRSSAPKSWSAVQAAKMHRRSVEMFVQVAIKADRDPMLLDIMGHNILFNDPEDPDMWLEKWLEEPSKVIIADDQLRSRDAAQDRAMRMRDMQSLAPLVQSGLISADKWAEEVLKAAGEQDPGDWKPMQAPANQMGGDPLQQPGIPSMVA